MLNRRVNPDATTWPCKILANTRSDILMHGRLPLQMHTRYVCTVDDDDQRDNSVIRKWFLSEMS